MAPLFCHLREQCTNVGIVTFIFKFRLSAMYLLRLHNWEPLYEIIVCVGPQPLVFLVNHKI